MKKKKKESYFECENEEHISKERKKNNTHTHTNTQAIFRACKGESNLSRRLWGCDNVPEGGIEAHTDWGFTCCCCCCFSFSRLIFYCRDNPPLLTSLPQPPPPSPHCHTVPNITVVFALTFFYFLWPKEIKETLTRGIIVYEKVCLNVCRTSLVSDFSWRHSAGPPPQETTSHQAAQTHILS